MMSPYTHVLFTSMTGIGFGLAVSAKNNLLKFVFPVLGWMTAMTLHCLWNSIPAMGGRKIWHPGAAGLLLYFLGAGVWDIDRAGLLVAAERVADDRHGIGSIT